MALVPTPEPEFVPGRPNIDAVYYENVNGYYVGKNEKGRADYMGAPDRAARKSIADAHKKVGLSEVSPKPSPIRAVDPQRCRRLSTAVEGRRKGSGSESKFVNSHSKGRNRILPDTIAGRRAVSAR